MRGPAQIDIVTPADDYDLVELDTLKILLNVTDTTNDAFLKLAVTQASGVASTYCNQPFVVEEIQSSYWPTRDGRPWVVRNGVAPLQLIRWPLTVVASVVETIAGVPTTLVEGTDYLEDDAKGQLTRLDSYGYPCSWRANPIVVNFSAGYETIPASVVNAVASIVKGMLYARTRDPMLRSENIEGVYEAQYFFGSGPGSSDGLPSSITGLLDSYRVPVIG